MQLRERAPVVVVLSVAAAAIVATLVAISARDTNRLEVVHITATTIDTTRSEAPVIVVMPAKITYESNPPASLDTINGMYLPEADAAYQRHAFGEASRIAREAERRDPSYRTIAELYFQFANAYYTGSDPGGRVTLRYEALREARKLDVVLGARFSRELDTALIGVAPKAAIAYTASREYEDAALACSVAESLGLYDDANVQAVRRKLRAEHR